MQPALAERFFQISLLLFVATGYAAVLATGRLDATTAALAGAALCARALIMAGWLRLRLSRGAVLALTIAYIGFYPLDYLYLSRNFLDATVRLVFFLAALKVLTAQTGRDYLFVGVIGLLQILSAAMLTDTPRFFGFLALFTLCAVAARTSYDLRSRGEKAAQSPVRRLTVRLTTISAVLALGIAALGLALFFVVPRAAGAYLAGLPPSGESTVGFSEHIRLDATGRINASGTPVLHVRLLQGSAGSHLKWRGGALGHFDGTRWSNPTTGGQVLTNPQGDSIVARVRQPTQPGGPRIRYRVLRAGIETDALFFAGIPEVVSGRFYRLVVSDTDSISLPGSQGKPVRYEAVSYIGPERPIELRNRGGTYPGPVRATYLQLPSLDPRVPRLARDLTASQVSPYWRAAALEHYLRTEFAYTLDLPTQPPADPLADFLFQRKKGHCEYFASAMTVMLRTIGIPARVAIGYQGGAYNPVSGYYTIRSSDAHSWVEAYFPDFGWVPFDPTPEGLPSAAAAGSFARLGWYLDALETYWQDWVVQYDLARQLQLGRSARNYWLETTARFADEVNWDQKQRWFERQWRSLQEKPTERAGLGLSAAVGFVLAVWAIAWGWPLARARIETWFAARRIAQGAGAARDCAILYSRALAQLRRRGFPRAASQTPEEFVATVTGLPPGRLAGLRELTELYNRSRFGRDTNAARQMPATLRTWESLPWRPVAG